MFFIVSEQQAQLQTEFYIICKLLFRSTIFLYKLIVYIVLDFFYCILRLVSGLWPFVA